METEEYEPEEISHIMDNDELVQLENSYSAHIDKYKYNLYNNIVAKDTQYANNSIEPIYRYHSLFLQSIAYWISLLDHVNIPAPDLSNLPEKLKQDLINITNETKNIINSNTDNRTIAYNVLNKKSTEPPLLFVR
jgi:hypothetical protein